ncbi:hypothetical protein [Citrobacter sp. RHBSTW-00229]|uniref:hypothetical protein n=1 Tax=Citrobacter sp. RHBSTW-00229 TaxID=2742641 RepID=UPI0020175BC9|nr:hypothetical protein [Citrobacter sp. RHBSTW-00229]
MSTITKELAKLFRKITNSEIDAEGNAHVVLFPADSLLINNARIALASMDAEPVGYFYADKPGDWYQISDGDRVPSHRRIPLYANPQSSPVVKLPNEFFSSEGIVVQIEKLMAVLAVHGIQYERRGNACRAAMLQAGNHTEQHLDMVDRSGDANEKADCRLPFDQWLSQQNETIDVDCGCVTTEAFYHWLRVAYEAGNSPVIGIDMASEPDRSVEVRYLAPPGYVMVPVEPTMAMLDEFDSIIDYGAEDSNDAWSRLIAAAPQQDVRLALEIGMSRYAGAMQKLVDSGD